MTPEEAGLLWGEFYCLYMDTGIVGTETNEVSQFIDRYIRLLRVVMDGGEWDEQEAAHAR